MPLINLPEFTNDLLAEFDARNAERHDLQFTRSYYAALPAEVRQHLTCRVVDALEPIHQAHSIEGLMMGEA
jgi:hypothetical protein